MIEITLTGQTLALRPHGYDEMSKLAIHRCVPCARWSRAAGAWRAPATHGALGRIAHLISSAPDFGVSLRVATNVELAIAARARRPADDDSPLPFETTGTPWRHQRCAHHFLRWARESTRGALLDCGMRTGKTRMVLEHLASLAPELRRGLVITPTSVVDVWPEQCEKHLRSGMLNVIAVEKGTVAKRIARVIEILEDPEPGIAVIGWAVLERLTIEQKMSLRTALTGRTVVADEVHFAQAAGSSRSKALSYISEFVAMRIGASGTPLAHSPLDAYGVFRFIDPGLWGESFISFRDEYAVMGGYGRHQVLGFRNLDDLASRMAPYTFRATRDVLELPAAQHIDIPIHLPPHALAVYDQMERECIADLKSGTLLAANSLSKLMRLAQIASGYLPSASDPAAVEPLHDEKEAALVDLFDSCDPTEPWVVFCRFHHDLDAGMRAATIAGRVACEFSGRSKELDQWRAACRAGKGAVLVAQIQSGGIGISLVEAAYCAYISIGYSLAEWQQSLARIHGPEQTRPVAYYHLIAKGTVDEDIREALDKRADILSFVARRLMHANARSLEAANG